MTRIAIVKQENCNPKECGDFLCARLCPVNRKEQDCIIKSKKAIISEELCTGCGICSGRCPFQAISIINLPEQLKGDPIHRYGLNMFELFHLPIPKKNKIVGILGRNGIGKSTAFEILAGNITPNLGKYKEKPNKELIIQKYSTSYLGEYFKKLYENKIKVAYKPQRIELIPKFYKGKVKDLIDKNNLKLLKEFDLENLKDRNIKDLSGGELQKLAILATLLKNADVYYIDEPASFLDITSRIKIAKLIRKLTKDKSVLIVEHDLATLDYISDEIQIVYGEPACYGVFSQSKSVRRGINEYLDGYLPDDNIRIRDYKIFFDKAIDLKIREDVLFEFPEFEKHYDEFKLKVNSGKVNKKEVLCVMGANSLGKTTFLKVISGIEKANKGKIEKKKISYKVQYPSADVKGTVQEWLIKVAKEYSSGWYKQNILEKLGLGKLLNLEIKNLSGGELQKLYIAVTLSQEADVYAFDEPSAFIDVEDRLKVAEVIKDFILKNEKSAIVVDHDVQFIDYLADRMLVFKGIPGKEGFVYGPCSKKEGMNLVLKELDITYRKDKDTNRPRINKPDSQLDREQKEKEEYYYS